jgi:hypothetical protein
VYAGLFIYFNLGIFSMQLYFFKDSFTIHLIKTGKKILLGGYNLRILLELPHATVSHLFLIVNLLNKNSLEFYKNAGKC